jgi:hypothetical protein
MEWRLVTFVLVLLLLAVRIDAAYYSPEDKRHYYPEYKLRAKAAHDLARTHVVGETLASAAGVYNNKTRSTELGIMRTVMITVIQYSEKSYYKLYFYNLLCFARHHDIDLVVYVVHHGLKDWEGEVKSYAAMGVKVLPYPDELFWSLLYSNSWVAMYAGCVCKIKHVICGMRVALIYGLYCVTDPLPDDKGGCMYDAQYDDDSDDECECEEEEGECDVNCDDEDGDADEGEGECMDQPAAKRTKADVERGMGGGGREVYSRGDYDVIWHHMGDDEYVPPLDRRILRGADAEAIYTALNQELAHHDSVVICLQHMYPACLAVPGFLKPTDADLHSLLREHYSLQVVYCFVYCKEICNVYSRDSGQVRAIIWPDSETATATAIKPTKLVIPATLYPNSVLDYTPNLTAHQRARVDTAFVITGLRVSAKV